VAALHYVPRRVSRPSSPRPVLALAAQLRPAII
jgi:hypothetical protein